MRLHQVKLEYKAAEDRLLMRLAGEDDTEVLLYITRRVVKYLWHVLLDMARSAPDIQLQASDEARYALLGLRHEAALAQANFSERYDDVPRERPLGAQPILVGRMEKKRDEAGQHVLGMFPIEGEGVYLTLDDSLLHGFMKLVENGVAKADWSLDLRLSPYILPMHAGGETHPTH
jgi:hypothetical protein